MDVKVVYEEGSRRVRIQIMVKGSTMTQRMKTLEAESEAFRMGREEVSLNMKEI